MTDQNPYLAPGANLNTSQEELYQPRIFSFNGRIGRLRYLAYGVGTTIILMTVFLPLLGGSMALSGGMTENGMPMLMIIGVVLFYLAAIVMSVTFGKRRLNDLNRTGWWMLVFFVPIANLLMTIYVVFFPGSREANDYGPAPVANSIGVKILGWILPVIFLVGIIAAIAIPQYHEYVASSAQMQ